MLVNKMLNRILQRCNTISQVICSTRIHNATLGRCKVMFIPAKRNTHESRAGDTRKLCVPTKTIDFLLQNDFMKPFDLNDIVNTRNFSNLTRERIVLLLHFCGTNLPDKTLSYKRQLCEEVWEKLKSLGGINSEDYKTYLKICTENEVKIDVNKFIESMNVVATGDIFLCLLVNVCTLGDTAQAEVILNRMMREHIPIDVDVYNALILGHGKQSGLLGVEKVLNLMKRKQISPDENTNWSILKGLSARENCEEFLKVLLKTDKLPFNEKDFLNIIFNLGRNGNQIYLLEFLKKFNMDECPTNLHQHLDNLCVNLVYRGKPVSAVEIYCNIVKCTPEKRYAKFLLKELLKAGIEEQIILDIAQYLKRLNKNIYAVEDVTEIALKSANMTAAWKFLEALETLRCHYFWPLILHFSKKDGEVGLFKVLKQMTKLNVPIDAITLEEYCIPMCKLLNPKEIVDRFQMFNLTVRQILPSVLVVLFKQGDILSAHKLCKNYDVILDGVRLIHPFSFAWKASKDTKHLMPILRRICEGNSNSIDFVGKVLLVMLQMCKDRTDYVHYLNFLKELKRNSLLLGLSHINLIHNKLKYKKGCFNKEKIQDAIDDIIDMSTKEGNNCTGHVRNMSLEDLECHLIELRSKNMETRSVMRHLILTYCRTNNEKRVMELRAEFKAAGYEESPGIKSSIMHSYTMARKLEFATKMYDEIKQENPSFKIDAYKIIDLATLMVSLGMVNESIHLLKSETQDRTIRNNKILERNCWELIRASRTTEEALQLLNTLVDCKYSDVTNIILGPVVKSYIKCDNVQGAVDYFVKCAKTYKFTPLQRELMNACINHNNLLQRVLETTEEIHGSINTKMTLITVLAENGLVTQLKKLLMEMEYFPKGTLINICTRLTREGKVHALINLSETITKVNNPMINNDIIYLSIIQFYSSQDDCDGALAFIQKLREDDVFLSKTVLNELQNLLDRCHYPVNDNLLTTHV